MNVQTFEASPLRIGTVLQWGLFMPVAPVAHQVILSGLVYVSFVSSNNPECILVQILGDFLLRTN